MSDDDFRLDLESVSRSCRCSTELIVALVHEGAIEPQGTSPADWRFGPQSLARARRAARLTRDLELDAPAVALVLDLLDEVARLQAALAARR